MSAKEKALVNPKGMSGLVLAGSLALAIMTEVKVHTWAELADPDVMSENNRMGRFQMLTLSPDQTQLLDYWAERGVLKMLHCSPTVALFGCSVCDGWGASRGDVPKRCHLTFGCPGTLVKSKTASFTEIKPAPEPEPEPEPEIVVAAATAVSTTDDSEEFDWDYQDPEE